MANLSPETLERLKKFKTSDKFLSLKPETKERLNSFLGEQTPNGFQSLLTNLSRPGALVRERIRGLGETGNIEEANRRASEAWMNPEISETFQNERIRQTNELLPEDAGTAKRFAAGVFPSVGGLIEDFLSDPIQLAAALATEGTIRGLSPVKYKGLTLGERASKLPLLRILASKEGRIGKATDLSVKARDEAARLFPQAKGNIEQVRNTAEQVSKYASPSKNYEELANQLELAKGINAGERAKLYQSGVLSESRTQHDPILKLLDEYRSSPTANTPEGKRNIKLLEDIQTSDVDFLNNQPKESLNDPNFYQGLKEHYQNLANKAGAYKTDPSESIKSEAYRAMSEGYQNKTYAVDEAVKPLNLEEKGLIEGTEYSREMAKGEALGMKPDLKKEAVYAISQSAPVSAARFARKGLWDRVFGSPAKGLTKKISKLMEKSEKEQSLADLIDTIIKGRTEKATIEYPKLLEAPPQKNLPSPEQFRTKDIKAGRFLPQGQSTGKTIFVPETGKSPINIPPGGFNPPVGEKLKIPQYSTIRETVKEFPQGSGLSTPIQEPLIMPKRLRQLVSKIINRRKSNF